MIYITFIEGDEHGRVWRQREEPEQLRKADDSVNAPSPQKDNPYGHLKVVPPDTFILTEPSDD